MKVSSSNEIEISSISLEIDKEYLNIAVNYCSELIKNLTCINVGITWYNLML